MQERKIFLDRVKIKQSAKEKITNNLFPAIIISVIPVLTGFSMGVFSNISDRYDDASIFVIAIFQILIAIFVTKFHMKNSLEKAELEDAARGLNIDIYLKFAGLYAIMCIKVALWSLLLVIPGIVKQYEYFYAPYVFLEDPTKTYRECFEESKLLTDGIKTEMFITSLSFIGWWIGSVMTAGILGPFVLAYQNQTMADIYYFRKSEI